MNSNNSIQNKSKNFLINQNLDIYIIEYSQLFKNRTNKYFLCPFCQKKIPLIFPLIDSFSFNLLLFLVCYCGERRIISLKELFLVEIEEANNPGDIKNHCDLCLSNDNIENILFCLQCGIWICKKCREISFRKEEETHTFLNIKLYFQILCPLHEIYYKSYYCFTCKKDVCAQCIKKEHKLHEYLSNKDFFMKVDNKFQDIYLNCQKYFKKSNIEIIENINYFNENNIIDNQNNIINNSNKEIINKNKIIENDNKINIKKIYNLIYAKIDLNIKRIKNEYDKYFQNNVNISNNDINEINQYIINYFRLNIQLLYLIKFTYEKFLLLKQYNNVNIIINMNILTNFNKKEFKFIDINQINKEGNEFLQDKLAINIIHFKEKLKKFIHNNPIINLDEGVINFQLYNNFLVKKDNVKNILILNDYDYLILTDFNLLYFNTSENAMLRIVPKLIYKRVNFDIISQYQIKKDTFIPFNSNIKKNIDNIKIIVKKGKFNNEIKHQLTLDIIKNNKKGNIKASFDKMNISAINDQSFSNKHLIRVLTKTNIITSQDISTICKLNNYIILIGYKKKIIKCIFSKINNELISVNAFHSISAHKKPIYLINQLKNGYILTASEDKTFKIWNIVSSTINYLKDECLYTINKMIFSLGEKININDKKNITNNINEDKIICFGHKNGIYLCKNYKFNNLEDVINHKDIVTGIIINSENGIITGSMDGYIKKININNLKEEKAILMENGIISFFNINEYIFGAIIEEIGFILIHSLQLHKITYIKNWEGTIKAFGNLGEDLFYCMVEKEDEDNLINNNINMDNNYIRIFKPYMGNNRNYIVFT